MGLALRSWLWMAFVTTPAATAVGAAWVAAAKQPADVGGALLTVLVVSVPTGIVSLGGAIAATPFTFALGQLLTRCRARRIVHVTAHALLAGVLAALGLQVVIALWAGSWPPTVSWALFLSVPAGLAAALGTVRHTAPEPATTEPALAADVPDARPASAEGSRARVASPPDA
ncbi:hypothetical protein DEJ23_08130 [Curtobacterium sp. MCSS17_008]|nr:hypothetical protein DEJ23_08130 [Curtobacterium sp. MCSS17_008]